MSAPAIATTRAGDTASRMSLSDALALGPEVWDEIQAQSGARSPFMSWAWHRAWTDADPEAVAAQALVLRSGGGGGNAVQAIVPLLTRHLRFHRVRVRALTWAIGDLGCPDHLDVLATGAADLAALVPLLEELEWDVIVLSNLAPHAPGAVQLAQAMAARGHATQRQPLWVCPYLELAGDWETYLKSVTRSRRQALRYMEKNLRRHHTVTITDYDGERVEEGWRRLVALHERRWADGAGDGGEGGGAFRDPRVDRLHRRFAAELARRGQLWLTTLDLDGEPAAAWYGFTCADTAYFYQSGRDPRWERESVGQVLLAMMIRRAMERGLKRFDFLRGEDPYKRQWTTVGQTTEEITIFRRGLRGRWLRGVET
ncbi:MAG TPA: GNAT family N-acetyltransferase, partial [Gemmatimonadales bacterium]|nr:GNAT family N-acetyltransferase [Gemmatimonadales bacterium]